MAEPNGGGLPVTTRALWIGSYPPAGLGTPSGRGEGIYRVLLDLRTGELSEPRRWVETPAPSFVVPGPGGSVLYATDEDEVGRVAAFRVGDDGLEPLGTASSGGSDPCHLLVDGQWLVVANYGDGALGVLDLADDGSFASGRPQVLRHAGSGPVADRQGRPHAHFLVRAPGGHGLVVDLGTDQVRRYRRAAGGWEPAGIAATLPAGTGPRHLVFRASAAASPAAPGRVLGYLTGELDTSVQVLAWDAATDSGELVQTVPVHGPVPACGPRPIDGAAGDWQAQWTADGVPSPSHLVFDGDQLVVGVRGTGVLARFTVGADGLVTHRVDQPLPTPVPRHLAVVGGWTVVAEQVPGAVTVLDRAGAVVSSRAVPSAACITPAR